MANHGITGNWRGHYSYAKFPDEGSSFDALFEDELGVLTGHINDDFMLGEAKVFGAFSFPTLSFTKTYIKFKLDSVNYDGTMSDDGKTISGKWSISKDGVMDNWGSWTAHRTDKEEKKDEELKQTKVKLRETEDVL